MRKRGQIYLKKSFSYAILYTEECEQQFMTNIKMKPGLREQESEEKRLARRKIWRAAALLGIFCLIISVFILLFFLMRKAFFSENPHFKLSRMEIINGSYWKGKEKLLSSRTGIAPGHNLFNLDFAALRKKIESIPGIEKAEVVRILPDKLEIKVVERIPRAVLYSPAGHLVVDEKGVVIPRKESAVHGALPVITRVPGVRYLRPGEKVDVLMPSINLIMTTLRNYPDIAIECIQPGNSESLKFYMRYRGGKGYWVTIPLSDRKLPYLLSALQTAIINAHWKQLKGNSINLLYEGQVVLN